MACSRVNFTFTLPLPLERPRLGSGWDPVTDMYVLTDKLLSSLIRKFHFYTSILTSSGHIMNDNITGAPWQIQTIRKITFWEQNLDSVTLTSLLLSSFSRRRRLMIFSASSSFTVNVCSSSTSWETISPSVIDVPAWFWASSFIVGVSLFPRASSSCFLYSSLSSFLHSNT